jgi:hypothetical protein
MTEAREEAIELSHADAEALWRTWAPADDLLARAAFDRILRWALGIEDDGLYFRPGGWIVEVPATVARIACAAAILAAGFQLAGEDDLDREVVIATAGLVSAMNLRRPTITPDDRLLVERIRDRALDEAPLSVRKARKALPRHVRERVTHDDVRTALERLVSAGIADRDGDEYIVRSTDRQAWIRISLRAGQD